MGFISQLVTGGPTLQCLDITETFLLADPRKCDCESVKASKHLQLDQHCG